MTSPLADEILRRLLEAEGEALSGQSLAGRLGVTRAAIWKGVETLRAQGYPIQSQPARGYRLGPGPRGLRPGEIAATLHTLTLGHPVRHLARVDSTNREVERWALEGAPEGALVVAEIQEAGRGRLGRAWQGLPGRSLLASLLLRPPVPPAEAPLLTYAAALALAEALSYWVKPESIEIKWPNDVLLGGGKVAGILLEMRSEAQVVEHVILGVGVNVEGRAEDLPEELRDRATTVAAWATLKVDRLGVLCRFLEVFEGAYRAFLAGGFEALRPRWNVWFRMTGRTVRVQTPAGVQEGIALGLGPGGALLLGASDGAVVPIYAGDLDTATTRPP
ncbi:MAG: biotin--[acetyl-CoA-carboxylase] ligase [Deltaproteobacteria bacterium]|nr:biotin--[acetyl-CoA-carboxylase] ligase [Deltaproteobacteria bacterium]